MSSRHPEQRLEWEVCRVGELRRSVVRDFVFGGARMAILARPLPPRACVHCGAGVPSEIRAR